MSQKYRVGISDLMESAIEVKKSLKELATVSGLEVTESPMLIEIGEADFPDSVKIKSRTPDQIFCMLLKCLLKYLE